jgi:hypothetical protein
MKIQLQCIKDIIPLSSNGMNTSLAISEERRAPFITLRGSDDENRIGRTFIYRRNAVLSPINYAADIPYVASRSKNRIVGLICGIELSDSNPPLMPAWGDACRGAQLCLVLPITTFSLHRLGRPLFLLRCHSSSAF